MVLGRGTVDVGRHAVVAPQPRIGGAERDHGHRPPPPEADHRILQDLHHLAVGVRPVRQVVRRRQLLPGRLREPRYDRGNHGAHLVARHADRQADIGLDAAFARQHVHLQPARHAADVERGLGDVAGVAGAAAFVDLAGDARVLEHGNEVVRSAHRHLRHLLERGDDGAGDLVGTPAGVRIGAMAAGSANGDGDPDRRLLAEADAQRARRLARQQAIAHHQVAAVLEHPARSPRPERLLVGDGGVGQPTLEPIAHGMQVQECERDAGEPAFHVAGSPPIDAAIDDLAAPGVLASIRARQRERHRYGR